MKPVTKVTNLGLFLKPLVHTLYNTLSIWYMIYKLYSKKMLQLLQLL